MVFFGTFSLKSTQPLSVYYDFYTITLNRRLIQCFSTSFVPSSGVKEKKLSYHHDQKKFSNGYVAL